MLFQNINLTKVLVYTPPYLFSSGKGCDVIQARRPLFGNVAPSTFESGKEKKAFLNILVN